MIDTSGVTGVFRDEWPRLVATLMRDLGDLDLAEEAAQEAFLEAAVRWGRDGLPDRPGAWLVTTARRKAIDGLRRRARLDERLPELQRRADRAADAPSHQLVDDQLALLLGCCHPALAPDAQVALTLRVVGGLSTSQIARAFLVTDDAMARRLSRSKTKIRAANVPFTPVDVDTLLERLPAVCAVIYSIFTEGHTSATSTALVRGDLCDEALWLADLLADLVPDAPEVLGLLALLLLVDSRRDARLDDDGTPVLLTDQDRSRWDRDKIERGLAVLARAHRHRSAGPYQLQAAIQAVHTAAPGAGDTDWDAIVGLYDVLLLRQPTAVVALNRAVAVAERDGPDAGLAAIDAIATEACGGDPLGDYPYRHSTRAELLARAGRAREAIAAFDEAIRHSGNGAQLEHLRRRRALVADRHPSHDRR